MAVATSTLLATTAVVGGVTSAFGKFQQGKEAQRQADFNARISEEEAGLIRQKSILNEFQQRKALRQVEGQQISAVASSGIELTGSPLDVIADSLANAELGIAIDKFNLETSALAKESEARELRRGGRSARRLANISAVSTLLETGATAGFRASKTVKKKTKIGEGN